MDIVCDSCRVEQQESVITRFINKFRVELKTEEIASLHICQWQTHKKVLLLYLLWRWICAIIFLAVFVCSLLDIGRTMPPFEYHYEKWFIYLTHWNILACLLQAWLAALICTKALMNNNRGFEITLQSNPGYLQKLYWVAYSVATVYSFIVTICYWVFVYNPDLHSLDILNLMVHAFAAIIMLLDLIIVGHPIKLEHAYYTTGLGVVYSIFSLVYYLLGGTDRNLDRKIYPLLDWQAPGHTICVCIAGTIFVVIIHLLCCVMCKIRSLIHSKLFVQHRLKSANRDKSCEQTFFSVDDKGFAGAAAIDLK